MLAVLYLLGSVFVCQAQDDLFSFNVDLAVADNTIATTTEEPVTTEITTQKVVDTNNNGFTEEYDYSKLTYPPRHVHAGTLQRCDRNNQASCNNTALERCVLVGERDPRCMCLAGFARDRDGVTCVAVKAYRLSLVTSTPFSSSLFDTTSNRYRKISHEARNGIFQAARASPLNNIIENVNLLGLRRIDQDEGDIAIEAHVVVNRAYAPNTDMVKENLLDGVRQILRPGAPELGEYLGSTDIYLHSHEINKTDIRDVNPCSEPSLNYCDLEGGVCTPSSRSFVCSCKAGYTDTSPNIREAPGEICTPTCNCMNGGECKVDEDGNIYCQCPSWYMGFRCEDDGKIILIVVSSILGGLLLIGIVFCICCVYKMSMRPKRYRPEPSVIEEIDRSESEYRMYKRPYIDTKYYSYTPYTYYPYYLTYWPDDAPTNTTYPALTIPRPHTHGVSQSVTDGPPSYNN